MIGSPTKTLLVINFIIKNKLLNTIQNKYLEINNFKKFNFHSNSFSSLREKLQKNELNSINSDIESI
tara:strand:+ start:11236 stop:11436 length:201 start_codon:yes stop_codon:yes gene_type:complete